MKHGAVARRHQLHKLHHWPLLLALVPWHFEALVNLWGSTLNHQVVVSKIFNFQPYGLPREMIQFDEHIFQMGWFNHQLDWHFQFPAYHRAR